MKIGIDIRCLSGGRRTGVEEYSLNLLEKIFKEDKKNQYVLFLNSWKEPKIKLDWLNDYKNVKVVTTHFPNKVLNFFIWYFNWPKLDKLIGGVDVFFAPNINFLALSSGVKFVLTIHDLSFEYYPETFSWKRRMWHMFVNPKRLSKRADVILAVSDSTKRDLINLYNIGSEKIEIVYNGVGENFKKVDRNDSKLLAVKEKYKLPFNFIFFLGTFEPRKNIPGLVYAYEILREEKNSNLDKFKLVIAGSEGWKSEEIKKIIKESKYRDDIFCIKFIKDEDKVFVYNLASVFVYPSFFEGFGIPPLEAIKCGTPVVASNNSSLVESVDNGGILIDSYRPDEIAMAIREIILSKELRDELSLGMSEQVQIFSWSKSAKKFIEIIKKFGF